MRKYIIRAELAKPIKIDPAATYTIRANDEILCGVTLRQRKYRDIYRLYGYAQSNRADAEKRTSL